MWQRAWFATCIMTLQGTLQPEKSKNIPSLRGLSAVVDKGNVTSFVLPVYSP